MEEIEELRAKAIASMPFSTNPNSSSTAAAVSGGGTGKFKSPRSREEGEVSSSEDAELPTCSVAPTNSTNLGESMPYTLKNSAINAARSSTTAMQLRPSVMQNYQNYHKHFKRKLPFRSLSSQALHWHANWHAKESKNNLVISFSDDDSGSESEECNPEKDVKTMDSTSVVRNSRIAVTSLPKPTDGIEREPDGSKLMPKKGFVNHETISSVHSAYETSCGPQGPSAENGSLLHRQNPAITTSTSQELGHAQDSTMADQRLELLRHQIAARENKLKAQNKSVQQKGATVCSDSTQDGLHAMKPDSQATGIGRHAHDTTLEFEVNEPSEKRLKHDTSSSVFDLDVPSQPENNSTFHADNSCIHHHPKSDNTVKSSVIKSNDSFLVLSASNLHDGAPEENDDVAKNVRPEKFSKKAGVSTLPSNHVSSMHIIKGNQQMTPTTDVLMPLETISIYKNSSGLGGLVNNEASMTEEGSMSFHSLVKLEELLDKELEDAQEYRCKCELEERQALKAYRKAQRSLVEANERCTFLYGKRALFSGKFRAFFMEASNSICPSDWLCQQIPHEDQFYEPFVNTSVHRDNSPLDGAVPSTHNPNMSTSDDGEDFPSSNRVVESRSDHVDVQIEKAPSLDNSQDYELLEASLRSELVARLGLRAPSKVNHTSKGELDVEKRTGSVTEDMESSEDMERSPSPHKMMPISEAKQTAKLDGIERTQERSCLLSAPLDFKSLANASSNEELHSIADLGTQNSFPKNSGSPTNTAVFSLPASGLHSVCRHTYMIFPGCQTDTFNMKENDYIVTSKEIGVTDFIPDNVGEVFYFKRPTPTGYRNIYESSVEIDPFWPLCMFEFRGKCNDEECQWQHMKAGMYPNSRHAEHSNAHATCLPIGKLDAPRFPCSILHVLPIPTYQIGPYLIKADSHQSQSVLARSNLQYQQRGFCASFCFPFSVQRILPLDAPCLQPGDDPVADDYSWNRLPLYYRSQDDILLFKEQIKQASDDVEQLLEMALDQFDGELCEPDRKKALSLFAHAIESHPSSVVLWVVYLHIYYRKEKAIGKDDMFLHAVQHNKGSYELWLLYINSRMLCEDRLNAYDRALNVLGHIGGRDGRNHLSPYILDIFLQMIDFLCMSGHVDKVISRIWGLMPSNEFDECNGYPFRDICTCLIVPDRCLFWICCIYFIVYEKLPEGTVQQFEFAKSLPFGLDWPSAQLTSDRKALALEFMKLAMTEMASYLDDNPNEIDQASFQSLHFLAVSHVKCGAALLGSSGYAELLDKYLKLYPSCMELVLMAIRSQENDVTDLEFSAFEEALYHWPKETPGVQCLWNQCAEYALTNSRVDLAEKLMVRWYQDFPKFRDLSSFCSLTTENSLDSSSHINSTGGVQSKTKDDAFGFLNMFLYCMLQKSVIDARCAIDKSLELAAPEDYIHFVKEQALFMTSNYTESQKHYPLGNLSSLLNRYLADPRSSLHLEPLSRRFVRTISKPRIQQMVNNILGPVSMTSTLVNSVLKVCYGQSLLPEKFNEIKEAVSSVEFLMEMTPTNYELALSVYRICSIHPDRDSVKFWACSLLINSILQAAPVAPEHIWLEAANVLKISENLDITLRFHKQAISVYPFSIKLWQSYANLYDTPGDVSEIIEAARERGIELNNILK